MKEPVFDVSRFLDAQRIGRVQILVMLLCGMIMVADGAGRAGALFGPVMGGLILHGHWDAFGTFLVPAIPMLITAFAMLLAAFAVPEQHEEAALAAAKA